MAIQAQYPSHVLFLNRSEPETKNSEFSAAGFLDQPPLFFPSQPSNGGSSNTNRKRGREAAAPAPAPAAPTGLVSPPALNTTSTTLIDLSLLHSQQPAPPAAFVSTGLRLSFEDHPRPQQQPGILPLFPVDGGARRRNQAPEGRAQPSENLRRALAETRRTHYRALLGLAEQSGARRLREKDAEMERAARRNAELEQRVARLRAETVAWQTKARAEEAAAAVLQAQLQQAAERQNLAGDPGCSAVGDLAGAEDAESGYLDPERRETGGSSSAAAAAGAGRVCRSCRRRVAAVLVLPCRHLCLCRECAAGAEACPVCRCARTACLEVFLS
ncbi:unnamed protein product [Spirodela intermedia]|uniref:RING-type domain-containing protein n=1 Tax=Spirodela intermedia TaxID=51605 RepID=A0A7I8JII7_SPIIN|nr:unnamed protein product [Spirodela intermedia]CAA6669741.1 unnamed protein product [Spirodela intermedia]